MTGSSGGSSEINLARQLSRQLASGAATEPPEQPYVRLRRDPPAEAAPAVGGERFTSWDALLDWSGATCGAAAAFVVDPEGFVIGSRGAVPDDGFEGAGAELSYLMGQADAMNPEGGTVRAVRLDFPDRTLVGLRTEGEEAAGFVLAFLDPATLTPDLGAAILQVLERSLPDLG